LLAYAPYNTTSDPMTNSGDDSGDAEDTKSARAWEIAGDWGLDIKGFQLHVPPLNDDNIPSEMKTEIVVRRDMITYLYHNDKSFLDQLLDDQHLWNVLW
jgi:hypothetical protein